MEHGGKTLRSMEKIGWNIVRHSDLNYENYGKIGQQGMENCDLSYESRGGFSDLAWNLGLTVNIRYYILRLAVKNGDYNGNAMRVQWKFHGWTWFGGSLHFQLIGLGETLQESTVLSSNKPLL